MAQWKQYSGMWTMQQQMQAASASAWPGVLIGNNLLSVGRNTEGQLGDGTQVNQSSPIQVGSLTTWLTLAAGSYFSLATTSSGQLFSFGQNIYGQLGQNSVVYRSSPVQVGALTTWLSISSGYSDSSAILTDGTLWTWGSGGDAQLGTGSTADASSPVQVGSDTDWKSSSMGRYHALAVKTNGTLWAWGYDSYGSLGLNTQGTLKYIPYQVGSQTNWLSASAGWQASVAIKTNGTLWSWGRNDFGGGLGQNDIINRSSPVQVGALTNWASAQAGRYNVIALKTDGTLWTWGWNDFGSLGQNDRINRSSPVQVGSLTTWTSVNIGKNSCRAINADGTLWAWGSNLNGNFGNNSTVYRSSPVQIGSLTTWSAVCPAYDGNNTLFLMKKFTA